MLAQKIFTLCRLNIKIGSRQLRERNAISAPPILTQLFEPSTARQCWAELRAVHASANPSNDFRSVGYSTIPCRLLPTTLYQTMQAPMSQANSTGRCNT